MSLSSNFSKIESIKQGPKTNEVPISETSLKILKAALEEYLPAQRLIALGELGGQSAENAERRSHEASQNLLRQHSGTTFWPNLDKKVATQILAADK